MTTSTTTTSTTTPGRRADQLLERAYIAFHKAGRREQPSNASDVTDVGGVETVTLRNINGVLAVYVVRRDTLMSQAIVTTTVDQLFVEAFDRLRDPRSAEYKAGARAVLEFRIEGAPIRRPYAAGSAQDDAFGAGADEGHALWRKAQGAAAGAA